MKNRRDFIKVMGAGGGASFLMPFSVSENIVELLPEAKKAWDFLQEANKPSLLFFMAESSPDVRNEAGELITIQREIRSIGLAPDEKHLKAKLNAIVSDESWKRWVGLESNTAS